MVVAAVSVGSVWHERHFIHWDGIHSFALYRPCCPRAVHHRENVLWAIDDNLNSLKGHNNMYHRPADERQCLQMERIITSTDSWRPVRTEGFTYRFKHYKDFRSFVFWPSDNKSPKDFPHLPTSCLNSLQFVTENFRRTIKTGY